MHSASSYRHRDRSIDEHKALFAGFFRHDLDLADSPHAESEDANDPPQKVKQMMPLARDAATRIELHQSCNWYFFARPRESMIAALRGGPLRFDVSDTLSCLAGLRRKV